MNAFLTLQQIQRGGAQLRCHRQRYFFIKRVGWFVRTRGDIEICDGMELIDGVIGPFATRARARYYLLKLIYQDHPELFPH